MITLDGVVIVPGMEVWLYPIRVKYYQHYRPSISRGKSIVSAKIKSLQQLHDPLTHLQVGNGVPIFDNEVSFNALQYFKIGIYATRHAAEVAKQADTEKPQWLVRRGNDLKLRIYNLKILAAYLADKTGIPSESIECSKTDRYLQVVWVCRGQMERLKVRLPGLCLRLCDLTEEFLSTIIEDMKEKHNADNQPPEDVRNNSQ